MTGPMIQETTSESQGRRWWIEGEEGGDSRTTVHFDCFGRAALYLAGHPKGPNTVADILLGVRLLTHVADVLATEEAQKALDAASAAASVAARETEAKLTAIYNVDQELANVQYAGSGITIHISGTSTFRDDLSEAIGQIENRLDQLANNDGASGQSARHAYQFALRLLRQTRDKVSIRDTSYIA